jgi:hypothetical protein
MCDHISQTFTESGLSPGLKSFELHFQQIQYRRVSKTNHFSAFFLLWRKQDMLSSSRLSEHRDTQVSREAQQHHPQVALF